MLTKKSLIKMYTACIALATVTAACQEDEGYVPVSLEQSTLSYKAGAGSVTLFWDIPAEADYKFIRCDYTTPVGDRMRTASIYSDSLLVDNLLHAYGVIDFHLTTVSEDGTDGSTVTIQAQADAAEKTVSVIGSTQLTLSADGLWTDNQESTEGPLANLVDGDESTYFHMSWSNPTAFPHYIVVDLGKEVSGISFTYVCRDHTNCNNPQEMEVYGSSTFDGVTFDETAFDAALLASLSDLPAEQGASYTSAQYTANEPFRYLWLKVLSEVNGYEYVALAELTVNELELETNDPEQVYLDSLNGSE